MSTWQPIDEDAVMLLTVIPDDYAVEGLEYGAHVSRTAVGWTGYYVRPAGTEQWAVCRQSPAADELPGDGSDAAIVAAILEELDERMKMCEEEDES